MATWNGSNHRNACLISMILVAIIFAVYLQVGNQPFLDFDDNFYVTGNPHVTSGITGDNVIWAFTTVHTSNWHPVTWLSLMADGQLHEKNPGGYHITNVVIHALSSLLLLLVLFRISGSLWKSAFVAAMFALHPLHVESVAWVAERKDVLSAFFWFLTLLLYSEYVKKPKPTLYLFTLLSFVLGLMSKSMLVTLPIVMLFIDFWPLNRYQHEEQDQGLRPHLVRATILIKEKIPFLALSLLAGIITIYAQNKGGATRSFEIFPFMLRIENALVAYGKYVGKTFWPHNLAVFYPYPLSIPFWQIAGSLLLLLLLTAMAMRTWRRYPYLAVGWYWFLVTLAPVIGVFQVGDQSMADRYTYIPVIGLFIMATWGIPDLTRGLPHRQGFLAFIACSVIIVSAMLTWQQLSYWKDNVSLYQHSLQVTSGNYMLHFNLGIVLDKTGDLDGAISEYRKAIRIKPGFYIAYINLGVALAKRGYLDTAIEVFTDAVTLAPNDRKAQDNLEFALSRKRAQKAADKQ